MTFKAKRILDTLMATDRLDDLVRVAKQQPTRHIAVACELKGQNGFGRAVAQSLKPQDFQHVKPAHDLWTFLIDLDHWQDFRRKATQHDKDDDFLFNDADDFNVAIVLDSGNVEIVDLRPMRTEAITPTFEVQGGDRHGIGKSSHLN